MKKRQKSGPKPKSPEKLHSKSVRVHLTPDQWAKLVEKAGLTDLSLAAYIRQNGVPS